MKHKFSETCYESRVTCVGLPNVCQYDFTAYYVHEHNQNVFFDLCCQKAPIASNK